MAGRSSAWTAPLARWDALVAVGSTVRPAAAAAPAMSRPSPPGTALAQGEAAQLVAAGSSPRLAELAAAGHELDAALLAELPDEGDEAAASVLDRACAAIGALCVACPAS